MKRDALSGPHLKVGYPLYHRRRHLISERVSLDTSCLGLWQHIPSVGIRIGGGLKTPPGRECCRLLLEVLLGCCHLYLLWITIIRGDDRMFFYQSCHLVSYLLDEVGCLRYLSSTLDWCDQFILTRAPLCCSNSLCLGIFQNLLFFLGGRIVI